MLEWARLTSVKYDNAIASEVLGDGCSVTIPSA